MVCKRDLRMMIPFAQTNDLNKLCYRKRAPPMDISHRECRGWAGLTVEVAVVHRKSIKHKVCGNYKDWEVSHPIVKEHLTGKRLLLQS